jgi:sensor histidine kinase YesM
MTPKVRWITILIISLIIGLTFAAQQYISMNQKGFPTTWGPPLKEQVPFWLVWGLISPLIFSASRKITMSREQWKSGLLKHVPLAISFSLLHLTIYLAILVFIGESDARKAITSSAEFLSLLAKLNFGIRIWSYVMLAAIGYAIDYYGRYQEGTIRASQLEAQLAQAQLQALKMQLHPHFLFNTLNSISALLRKDADAADHMLARLGDFLRLTLRSSGSQEVTVDQELEFLRCYLEIEQIRFQDRLTVDIHVDPEATSVKVPNLILQPIVENAIRHGIAAQDVSGHIEISARCLNGSLEMKVRDNGPGLPRDEISGQPVVREGVGIKNTVSRLQQMYGTNYRFDIGDLRGGGLEVTLSIPLDLDARYALRTY